MKRCKKCTLFLRPRPYSMEILYDLIKSVIIMAADIETQSSCNKIDLLNQQAWEIRISDSNKAFQLSKEAIGFSRKINYEKGIAEGLRIEAFGYIRMADYEKANACLEEALVIFHSQNDIRGLAVVNEYLGII